MRNIIIVIVILIIGGALWYVGSPLFIDKEVSEAFPAYESTVVATGSFTGFDRLHNGSGTAKLIKTDEGYVVRFEEDFSVTNGPDLYVGFGRDGDYAEGSEIAALKGNKGSQNYSLPDGFDPNTYNEVWIWCKQFSVPFAKARLE